MNTSVVRQRASVVLLITLVALVAACGERPEVKRQKAFARGEEYFKQRKHNEAIIEYQNTLQVDREFVPALHALGRTYARKFWFLDASRELGRANRLAPDSIDIAVDYGRSLVEVGDWEEADAQASAILAREPQNPHGFYIRAGALLGRAKAEEALTILEGLQRSGALPEVEPARAEALFNLGRSEQAEQVLRNALAKDPGDARSLAGLGAINLARKNYREAMRLYDEAKVLRPDDPRIRLGLAASKARLGKVEEAIGELEQVAPRARTAVLVSALGIFYMEANRPSDAAQLLAPVVTQLPRLTQARFLLGLAYLSSNQPDQALRHFEELERQIPNEPVVQLRLAQTESQLGRPREALARLEPVAKALAEKPEYHLERSRCFAMLGRLDEATKAAEAAQRLVPNSPQPYILLGEINIRQGRAKVAREMLTKAAEVGAGFEFAHLALGRHLLEHGEANLAFKEFDAAIKAAPQSLRAVRTKTEALIRQSRPADAVQFVESVVKAEPRVPGFHALLGALYVRGQQWKAADAAFHRELELAPRWVEARMGLAHLALIKQREDEAVGQLQEVVRIRPEHGTAVLLLSALYAKQGRSDLLVPVLEAAVRESRRQTTFVLLLGDVYLKTGRYDEAIRLMSDTLLKSKDLEPARLIRGQAHLAKGNGAEALKELGAVAKANPKSAEAQYFLAHAYVGLGRMGEAQAAYRAALALNPRFESAKMELAAISGQPLDDGTQRQQIESLQAAVKADPKNVLLREALARALFLRGQVQVAQDELKQILDVAPLHLGANFLTARILLQQGKGKQAAEYLEAVLRSNPSHVEAHVLLAGQLHEQGRVPEAIAHLEAALAADPNLTDTKYRLGHLYAESDRGADALAIARDLEGRQPDNPAPWLLRGRVLIDQGEPKAASEALTTALRLRNDMPEAHRWLGQAFEALGQTERAVESYRRALVLDGADAVALNNLAWVLAEARKNPDGALPLATKAALIAPQSPEVLDTLGWIHYRRGAYAEAEKVLTRAAERAPGSAAIQFHLGMTYHRLGRKTDAVFSLRRAAQLDPKLAETEKIADIIRELGG